MLKKKQQKNKQRRPIISDEALPEDDISNLVNFNPQIENKSSEVFEKIQKICKHLYFFNNLSDNELNLIINAFIIEKKK